MIEIPRLFDVGAHGSAAAKKSAIERKMIELIATGRFMLTAVMLQPEVDLVGEVIFGLGVDENLHTLMHGAWPTHATIASHRVTLEAVRWDDARGAYVHEPGASIRYKDGMRSAGSIAVVGQSGLALYVDGSGTQTVMVDNVVDTGRARGQFDLQTAWKILKQSGVAVARATRADHQHRVWRVREVPPSEAEPAEPGKGKR